MKHLLISKFHIKHYTLHTWSISENLFRKYWTLTDAEVLKHPNLKNSVLTCFNEELFRKATSTFVAKTVNNCSCATAYSQVM